MSATARTRSASPEGDIVALFNQIENGESPEPLAISEDANEFNATTVEPRSSEQTTIPCEVCDKILSCRSNYVSHLKTHISDFYCTICCNSYNTKFKLNSHSADHEVGDGAPQCVECDFEACRAQFPSRLQLYHHKNTHYDLVRFKCDTCAVEFCKESALENHRSRHRKEIVCEVCSKRFASAKTLADHERLHTGEKPFACDQCGQRFRCRSGLKYHQVAHTNEKKYHCRLCGADFLRSNYLKDHLKIHANEKPHECQHCGEKFLQMGVWKRHVARVHVKCDGCGLVVGKGRDLSAHKCDELGSE